MLVLGATGGTGLEMVAEGNRTRSLRDSICVGRQSGSSRSATTSCQARKSFECGGNSNQLSMDMMPCCQDLDRGCLCQRLTPTFCGNLAAL